MLKMKICKAAVVAAQLAFAQAGHAQVPGDAQSTPLPSMLGLSQNVPITARIDAQSLAAGRVHRFFLTAGQMPTGQDWLVPVVVIRGAKPGPKMLLTAGVHGDELNGIAVAHRVIAAIEPEALSGTITIVPGINVPGLLAGTRNYPFATGTGGGANLNRRMPGDLRGGNPADVFAAKVWNGVIEGNADFAVDLHTQSTGTAYPLYVFADMRRDAVEEMARLLGPDMLKRDPGQKGTIETTLVSRGIPAVTFEIGGANVFQYGLIDAAFDGLKRLMAAKDMIVLDEISTAQSPAKTPIEGNDTVNVQARAPGIVARLKDLLDPVEKGELVAVGRDAFGRINQRYTAPVDGHVAAIATAPMREEGAMIIRILTTNPSRSCRDGC